MKKFLKEYFEIIIYTISGLLIILSSYNIIINVNHAKYLNQEVYVSTIDVDLTAYKDNVIKIIDKVDEKDNTILKKIIPLLKNDGLFKVIPGDKLSYHDLDELNCYFIEKLINEGYISNIKTSNEFNNDMYDEIINNIIFNSSYLDRELRNNSNYHYDVHNNEVRNEITEIYKMILRNYKEYTYVILEMCDNL